MASTLLPPSKSHASFFFIFLFSNSSSLRNVKASLSKVPIMQCSTVVTHQRCEGAKTMNKERNQANREREMHYVYEEADFVPGEGGQE